MAADVQLRTLVEALRATRDADVNYKGLQTFRRLLRRPAVVLPLLAAYTTTYPGWVELSAIWDAQASRNSQDMRITVELLELLAELLTLPRPSPAPAAKATAAGASASTSPLQAAWASLQPALDDLATSILTRRLKQLYFALGSGVRPKINAALLLLGGLASRGTATAAALAGSLDWSLPALTKLARPPRLEAGQDVSMGWSSWSATSLGRRPCRALWLEFACELLRCADGLLLPRLLTTRPLMTGLLAHLATDPPGVALGVLRLLCQLLGGRGGRGALGPAAAGAPWREAALAALAELVLRGDAALAAAAAAGGGGGGAGVRPGSGWRQVQGHASSAAAGSDVPDQDGSDLGSEGSTDEGSSDAEALVDMEVEGEVVGEEEEGEGKEGSKQPAVSAVSQQHDAEEQQLAALVEAAAAMAYQMLLQLVTDPALGLAGGRAANTSSSSSSSTQGVEPSSLTRTKQPQGAQEQGGRRRLLLFLRGLSPGSSPRHLSLVQAAIQSDPGLATPLLLCCPWGPLEVPRPEQPWQVAMALTAWLVAAAGGSQGAHATSDLQQAAGRVAAGVAVCEGRLSAAAHLMQAHDIGGTAANPATSALLAAVEGALAGARGFGAPSEDSGSARGALAAVLPPGLTRLGLSRGLQHPAGCVVSSTLTVLAACCTAAQQLLEGLLQASCCLDRLAQQAAAALGSGGLAGPQQAAAVHQVREAAASWRELRAALCRQLRARLPEPSLLVGLLGQLAAVIAQEGQAAPSTALQGTQQKLCLQLLLVVLGGYVLLGGGEGAGLDPIKHLMTQALLQWPPALQAAALRVVATASAPPAGTPHHPMAWSSQQLSVLLALLVGHQQHPTPAPDSPPAQHHQQQQQQQVQQMAYRLLCSALARVCGADWEPGLWVGCLCRLARCTTLSETPTSSNASGSRAHGQASARPEGGSSLPLSAALVHFLVEAVAAAGRRPLEAAEVAAAVGGTLPGVSVASEVLGLQQAASPLALTALRQALRLAASPRAAPTTQAVVAGYVAAVWHLMLTASPYPAALALLLQQVLVTASAPPQPGQGEAGQVAATSSKAVEVPAAAAPLVSLWVAAQAGAAAWMASPVAANGTAAAVEPPPTKRHKRAPQSLPHDSISRSGDWREGVIQVLGELKLSVANDGTPGTTSGSRMGLDVGLQAAAGLVASVKEGVSHLPPHSSHTSSMSRTTAEVQVLQQLLLACLDSKGADGAAGVLSLLAQLGAGDSSSSNASTKTGLSLASTLLTAAQALPAWPQQQLVEAVATSNLLKPLLEQVEQQEDPMQLPLLLQAVSASLAPMSASSSSSSRAVPGGVLGDHQSTSCLAAQQPDLLACIMQAVAALHAVGSSSGHRLPPAAAGAKLALLYTLVNTLVMVAPSSSAGNITNTSRPSAGWCATLTAGFQVLRVALLAAPHSATTGSPPDLDEGAVAAVLQHPGLATAWLGPCSCGVTAAQQLGQVPTGQADEGVLCSSRCLSAHLVLLLRWLLTTAAAAQGGGSCASRQHPVAPGRGVTQLVELYVQQAVQVCSRELAILSSSQGLIGSPSVCGMAATAVVQLLPAIRPAQLLELAEACAGLVAPGATSGPDRTAVAAEAKAAAVRTPQQQQQGTAGKKKRRQHDPECPSAAGTAASTMHLGPDVLHLVLRVGLAATQQVAARQPHSSEAVRSASPDLWHRWAAASQRLVAYAQDALLADPCCDAAAAVLAAAAWVAGDGGLLMSNSNSHTGAGVAVHWPSQVQVLFRAALTAPLTQAKVTAAQQIAAAAPQHLLDLVHVLQHQLTHHLLPTGGAGHQAVAAGGGKEGAAAGASRREVLALLLPVAHTLLAVSLAATAAAAAGARGDNGTDLPSTAAAAAAGVVADLYRTPLLAYFSRRRPSAGTTGPGGKASSGGREEQQLSRQAGSALVSTALPVLRMVLIARPLESADMDALLTKLLRPQGLPLPPADAGRPSEASESQADVAAGASALQQLQLASWLIQGAAQQQPAQQGLAHQPAAASFSSSSSGSSRQLDPRWLMAYAVTCTNTLAALYRVRPAPPAQPTAASDAGITTLSTTPSSSNSSSSGGSWSLMEAQLVEDLDGWVGDGLAALRDDVKGTAWLGTPGDAPTSSSRSSSSSSRVEALPVTNWQLVEAGSSTQEAAERAALRQQYSAVLGAVQGLALAALKRRLGDRVALRCLRRLLAALAPSGELPAAVQGSGAQQQAQEEREEEEISGRRSREGAGTSSHSFEGGSTDPDDSTSTSQDDIDMQPSLQGNGGGSSSIEHDEVNSTGSSGEVEELDMDGRTHTTTAGSSSSRSADNTDTDTNAGTDAETESEADDYTDKQGAGAGMQDHDMELLPGSPLQQQQPGSPAAAGEPAEQQEEEAGPVVVVVNPGALELAGALLQRLTSHSGFVAALMGEDPAAGGLAGGLLPLPPHLACLPSPPSSLGPLVEALLSGGGAGGASSPHPSPLDSSSSSGSNGEAVRLEVVLLLEVLMDLLSSWEAADPCAQTTSITLSSPHQRLAACVELSPLLALLAAAWRGSLGEGDRALLRCLLGVDAGLRAEGAAEESDCEGSGAVPKEATTAAAALSGPWATAAGCLWGAAAPPLLATPATTQQLQEVVAAALAGLHPLRAALTVAVFPDRRALPPGQEPQGGVALHQLYWSAPLPRVTRSSDHEVLPGVAASVAAAAYDPVALLLLGVSSSRLGALSPLVASGSGLVAVALRALAAEDGGLRGLAYELLGAVAADLDQTSAAGGNVQPAGADPVAAGADVEDGTTPQPASAAVGSARRLTPAERQLSALLSWVRSGVRQPGQQLPAASAVLAAEVCLLLTGPAPPATLHSQAARLLLRQPALDVSGLPLLGRLLYGRGGGSASSSRDGAAGAAGRGAKSGLGQLSAAAAAEGQQWLLHLLWLGLRGPADARMYSRQYVVELLLAATSSPTTQPPSGSTAAPPNGRGAMSLDLAHTAAAAAAAVQGPYSSSSSGSRCVTAFDAWVGALVRQALVLPGAAAHLVAAAGCVPWLGGVAAQAIRAAGAATPWATSSSTCSESGSTPPWALQCLTSLLARHICLRQRAQAAAVFGSYLAATAAATQALMEVCNPWGPHLGAGLPAAPCATQPAPWWQLPLEVGAAACSVPPALVPHLTALLDLLLEAAQAAGAAPGGQEALGQLLGVDTLWRLLCTYTAAAAAADGSKAAGQAPCTLHPTQDRLLQLLQVLGQDGTSPSICTVQAGGQLALPVAGERTSLGASHPAAVRLARWVSQVGGPSAQAQP